MAATESNKRWSLATLIFLLTALLIMLVVGLSVGVGVYQGQRFADAAVDEALDRATITQLDLERLRAREIELIAEGLAKDDAFVTYIEDALGGGGLFGETEVDRVSIADQLSERRTERDLDLAILLDAEGRLIARTDRQVRADESLDEDPLVAELVAELVPLSAIWRDGDALYQMAMRPLDKGASLIGFLLIGRTIDTGFADEIKRATGADQTWLAGDAAVASTLITADREKVLAALRADGRLQGLLAGASGAYRMPLRIERARWMASVEPIGIDEETVIGAVVSLLSLDDILASHRQLWQILIAVGLGAVLLGLLLSLALSRRVVRPLSQLAVAAAAASEGDYQQEFEATGSDETERLGRAFSSLLSDLREKRDMEEYVADLSRYLPDPAIEQSATSRSTPALGRPARDELALLALDYRHLANVEDSGSAEDNVRRFQSSLSQIAALAEALEARLESFSGHRALVGFRGEEAIAHALEFAGHVSEHASEVPSMALVAGRVDRGMVRAGVSSAEVLIGKASHQVDLLLEEARPGNLLFSPQVREAAAELLDSLGIETGVQSGRLSGRKYNALGADALAGLASQVSDQTRRVESGAAESVIQSVSRTREIVPGDVFADRFEVISVLGQGGMGMVYKALDRELEDFVALKTLRPEIAGDEKYLQQLKEEIKLARRITHPNVLRTFDFGSHEGVAYISMEYVRGMTLRYLMRQRSRLPYSAGLRISRQTCAGLAAAHAQDVVHRDIKPENIILKANGNAKLMDFGIALPVVGGGDAGIGVFIGTASYAAPEQMEGQRVDARADVYAMGVLMYELFAGTPPCRQTDLMELYTAKKNEDFKRLAAVWTEAPAGLNEVVRKCLAADPEQRYRDAEEVGRALAGLRA